MIDYKRVIIIGHFEGAADHRTDLEKDGLVSNGIDCIKINLLPYIKSRPLYLIRLLKSFLFMFQIKSNDIVLIYGESLFFVIDTFFLKRTNCKIVFERTEYPNSLIYNTINTNSRFLNNLKNADGFITCSDALKEYYKQYLSSGAEVISLPLLVDSNKFYRKESNKYPFKYIAYCGYMGNDKDGVSNLIDSFKKVSPSFNDIKLLLVGPGDENELLLLKEKAKDFQDNIIFTGPVLHSEMPEILSGAMVLALARPSNKQAEGGFPSKLGEYLSTSKPVLVTDVGEISKYIKDEDNGYIVAPDNIDLFAEKLKYIFEHYDMAISVGKKGKQTAELFDYKRQTLILKNFLLSL